MNRSYHYCLPVFILALLVCSASVSFANGKNGQDHKHGMSQHMQDMYALKEKVPEDYQVMERSPVIPDEESLQAGSKIYRQYCVVCHGEEGRGDGPAAQGLSSKPANFLDLEHSAVYGPGEKFWIIGNGSSETGMPAFPNLSVLDRWNVVNYILDLQETNTGDKAHDHSH